MVTDVVDGGKRELGDVDILVVFDAGHDAPRTRRSAHDNEFRFAKPETRDEPDATPCAAADGAHLTPFSAARHTAVLDSLNESYSYWQCVQ